MLHFQIDPHSGVPVYKQLMDQIKYYVASGILAANDTLPSIREMARALSVNPSTIVKAYGELGREGIIVNRQGKGAFIAETAQGPSRKERREAIRRIVRQLMVEAKQMGVTGDEIMQVIEEERVRLDRESGRIEE